MKEFDVNKRDSQSTNVEPLSIDNFDIDAYADYEQKLVEANKAFYNGTSGIQVYRRVRADGVFFDKSKNYKESLELQLGALKTSMQYKADIANFLEPWYGIGYIASSFGSEYIWTPNQAPAVHAKFASVEEALQADYVPLKDSPIGKEIINTIDYFLTQTKGKIPMSYSDVQSPVNMLSYLVPINDLFIDLFESPEDVKKLTERVTDLLIDFLKIQQEMIGSALAKPGHGFASSRAFESMGMSADNAIMISPDSYTEVFKDSDEKIGSTFNGLAFHSCGTWDMHAKMVRDFDTIKIVDGAFSPQTDPAPNKPSDFKAIFENSNIIVNTRCVGTKDEVLPYFKEMISPNMKVIAVTYCEDPKDQAELYDALHALYS